MTSAPSSVVVLGFGPFQEIRDNPAARLASALAERRDPAVRVRSEVMPVSYDRSPKRALDLVAACGASAVLGIGVARGRAAAMVELVAVNAAEGLDVDGRCPPVLDAGGPARLAAHEDGVRLASELGVETSEDAGRYVCNAWLYRTTLGAGRRARPPAVAFLHIPAGGFDPDRLMRGIAQTWGRGALYSRRVPA